MSKSNKVGEKLLAFVLGTTLLSGGLVNIQSVSAMGPEKIASTNFSESEEPYWNEHSWSSNIEFVTGKKCNYSELEENDKKVVDSIRNFILCDKLDEDDNFKIFHENKGIFEDENLCLKYDNIKIKILKFTSNNIEKALVCIVVPDGEKLTEECMEEVKQSLIKSKIVEMRSQNDYSDDFCNVNLIIRPEHRDSKFFIIEGFHIKFCDNLTVNMLGAVMSNYWSISYCNNLRLNAPHSIIRGDFFIGEAICSCNNSIINVENSIISGCNAIYDCKNSLIFAKNSEIKGKRAISHCGSCSDLYKTKIYVSDSIVSGEEAIYECIGSEIEAKNSTIPGVKAISRCFYSKITVENSTVFSGFEAISECSPSKITFKNSTYPGLKMIGYDYR